MSRVPWLLAALLLLAVACQPSSANTGAGAAAPSPDEDLGAKPVVEVPTDEAPPSELVIEDLVPGEGPQATDGDTVTVHYVGVAWSTGKEFDSSWAREPYRFTIGRGQVIPGWDRGIAGMHVGGRRRLVIPPGLAYGERGAPPAIGPGETLVFVVDLLAIDEAPTSG